MLSEAEIYAEFVKAMKKYVHIHRIENAIASGTFDCVVSYANSTFWCEFKENDEKELRASQVSWAKRRMDHGCYNDMLVITMMNDNFIIALASDLIMSDGPINKCKRISIGKKDIPEFFLHLYYSMRGNEDERDREGTEQLH